MPSTSAPAGNGQRRLATIVPMRDLPLAELLVRSIRVHHPDLPSTVLVLDAGERDFLDGLPFDALRPDELGLEARQFLQMATYYGQQELAAALKPLLLLHLLDRGDDCVTYLDPNVEVYGPLDDLFEFARQGFVLTPHVARPIGESRDGPDPTEFLLRGQFNLGFLAVSRISRDFLQYLQERTRLYALEESDFGCFRDQRWVEFGAATFSHVVVRDPTCNVSYWNLHERCLERDQSGAWLIDGQPLRFIHLSGGPDEFAANAHDFGLRSPRALYRSSRDRKPTLVRFDQHPTLRQLLDGRASRLAELRWLATGRPYRWDRTEGGIELTPSVRRLYWQAVRAAEFDGVPPPPHAFVSDEGGAFASWLDEPTTRGGLVRHLVEALGPDHPERPAQFPTMVGASNDPFVDSARGLPTSEYEASSFDSVMPSVNEPLIGVNLVGYLDGDFGVAAAGRMVARIVRASGIPLAATVVRTAEHKHRHHFPTTLEGSPFGLSIFAINADGLLGYARTPAFTQHEHAKRVGIWYWEVGVFPEALRPALDLVDEVWCSSEHVRQALLPWADGKLRKHPLVFEAQRGSTALVRRDLGLPDDRFLFGFAFDYLSVLKRKNPIGLIEAYKRAFGPHDGAALILKTIHAHPGAEAVAEVREAAGDREDILLRDDHFDGVQMRALFHLIDCYVSLHRSEGLGLTIAAAMACGTPAIATGWSGNLEYMTADNSLLVPYDLAEVGPGSYPYPVDACWAEPDVDAAAQMMRGLHDDPATAAELGDRAAANIAAMHEVRTATAWFEQQFATLTRYGA